MSQLFAITFDRLWVKVRASRHLLRGRPLEALHDYWNYLCLGVPRAPDFRFKSEHMRDSHGVLHVESIGLQPDVGEQCCDPVSVSIVSVDLASARLLSVSIGAVGCLCVLGAVVRIGVVWMICSGIGFDRFC